MRWRRSRPACCPRRPAPKIVGQAFQPPVPGRGPEPGAKSLLHSGCARPRAQQLAHANSGQRCQPSTTLAAPGNGRTTLATLKPPTGPLHTRGVQGECKGRPLPLHSPCTPLALPLPVGLGRQAFARPGVGRVGLLRVCCLKRLGPRIVGRGFRPAGAAPCSLRPRPGFTKSMAWA